MRIVLDTNVLVSGLLSPLNAPGEIVRLVASGNIRLCFDARILTEYRSVLLRPKFEFEQIHIDALLDQITSTGIRASAQPLKQRLLDRFDEPFLEIALAAGVKYLVTGNLKHFQSTGTHLVKIISPSNFLEVYRKEYGPKS